MDNHRQKKIFFVGLWNDFALSYKEQALQYVTQSQQGMNKNIDYEQSLVFYCATTTNEVLKLSDYQYLLSLNRAIVIILDSQVKIHIFDDIVIEESVTHLVLHEGSSCLYEHDFSTQGIDKMTRQSIMTAYDNAMLDYYALYAGESCLHHSYYGDVRGYGAKLSFRGIFCAIGDQKIVIETFQKHSSSHTQSEILLKGFVANSASVSYKGTITIDTDALSIVARQEHKTLLLHDKASVQSVPVLEVLNKEVQCFHASAIGRMDKKSLFYLQSRGFDRAYAQRLFVMSFIQSVYASGYNMRYLSKKIPSIINNYSFL